MSRLRRFIWVPAAMIVVSGLAGAAAGCSGSGSASGGGGASGGGNAVVRASAAGDGGVALGAAKDSVQSLAPGTAEPFSANQDVGGAAAGREARGRPAEGASGASVGRHQDRRHRSSGRSRTVRSDATGLGAHCGPVRRIRDQQLDERVEDPRRPDHDPRARPGLHACDGRHRGHSPRPRDGGEPHRAGREPAVRRSSRPAREPGGAGEGAPAAHGSRADDLGVDPGRELPPAGGIPDRGRPGPHHVPPEPHVDVDHHGGAARGRQEAGASPARERVLEGRRALAGRRSGGRDERHRRRRAGRADSRSWR